MYEEYQNIPELKVMDGMNEHDGQDHFKITRAAEERK